jgi:hypothetical protein
MKLVAVCMLAVAIVLSEQAYTARAGTCTGFDVLTEDAKQSNSTHGNVVKDGLVIFQPGPFFAGNAVQSTQFWVMVSDNGRKTGNWDYSVTAAILSSGNDPQCTVSVEVGKVSGNNKGIAAFHPKNTNQFPKASGFVVSYACKAPGTAYVQLIITPTVCQSEAPQPIQADYLKTHGTAIIVGSTKGGSDVANQGVTTPAYAPANPTKKIGAYEEETTFYVQIAPNALEKSQPPNTENIDSKGLLTTCTGGGKQEQACGASMSGTLVDEAKTGSHDIKKSPLTLTVTYGCKVNGEAHVTVTIKNPPFADTVFAVQKVCQYTPGLTIGTDEAATKAGNGDVATDGNVKGKFSPANNTQCFNSGLFPAKKCAIYDWTQPKNSFFFFLKGNTGGATQYNVSKPQITVNPPNICTPSLSNNLANGAILQANTALELDVDYTCTSPGFFQVTLQVNVGLYKRVTFSWTHIPPAPHGNRPGFEIDCPECPKPTPYKNISANKVAVDGLVRTDVWGTGLDPSNIGSVIFSNDVRSAEFTIATGVNQKEKRPQLITDVVVKSATASGETDLCIINTGNLKQKLIEPEVTLFDMVFWCRPSAVKETNIQLTFQLENFQQIQFSYRKQVLFQAELFVTLADPIESCPACTLNQVVAPYAVNTEGSMQNAWGKGGNLKLSQTDYAVAFPKRTFTIKFGKAGCSHSDQTITIGAPELHVEILELDGNKTDNSLVRRGDDIPKDIEPLCSPYLSSDDVPSMIDGPYTLPYCHPVTLSVNYNCSKRKGVSALTVSLPVTFSDGEKRTPPQWRWKMASQPSNPAPVENLAVAKSSTLKAKFSGKSMDLSWTVGSDNGAVLLKYNIEVEDYLTGDIVKSINVSASTFTVSGKPSGCATMKTKTEPVVNACLGGNITYTLNAESGFALENGKKYQFSVTPMNQVGPAVPSEENGEPGKDSGLIGGVVFAGIVLVVGTFLGLRCLVNKFKAEPADDGYQALESGNANKQQYGSTNQQQSLNSRNQNQKQDITSRMANLANMGN